jgi:hypothetical protein
MQQGELLLFRYHDGSKDEPLSAVDVNNGSRIS